MSDNRAIETENWLTSSEAARISGYNTAYLARLAKQGHLLSRKQGRNWQIDYLSLKGFIATREKSIKQRHSELKIQRLTELYPDSKHKKALADNISVLEIRIFNISALLGSLAILMLGGLMGVLINAASEAQLTPSDMKLGAGNIAGVIGAEFTQRD